MRRLVVCSLLLLAACQPLPHPFADIADMPGGPPLEPPDAAGIIVLPASGAPGPVGRRLAEAMARALQKADVPASADAQNRDSYRLAGRAELEPLGEGRAAVSVDWQLSDATGAPMGHVRTRGETSPAAWEAGGEALLSLLVEPAAPQIARLVSGDAPLAAGTAEPLVALRGVTGAPGDGGAALSSAIVNALGRAGVAAGDGRAKAQFALAGRVAVSSAAGGKQRVAIDWVLSRPDGSEIGRVKQENAVAAGSLDGPWGDVAYDVAAAAAPGIAQLVEKARTGAAGG